MSAGVNRVNSLDPESFISFVEGHIKNNPFNDEVFIRRFISALYFSLIIYWASKKYYLENKRWRGSNQDNFSTVDFFKELYENGLDDILYLHSRRAAADHYVCNPTNINLYGEKKFIGKRRIDDIKIDEDSLKKCLEIAKDILNYLKESV